MELDDGLYDQVLSEELWSALSKTTDENNRTLKALSSEDVSERLADVLARQLVRILDDLGGEGHDKLQRQLDLVNSILIDVRHRLGNAGNQIDILSAPLQLLSAIHRHSPPPVLPDTGLAFPWLFTAGKGSPPLLTELRRELAACDQVDTLLLLRPTQSPVLFQQQIGRGLRLAKGKEGCLVLDFVGRHREEFRFDRLLSSITGLSRGQLIDAVDKGFGALPPGCHIHLQRQARDQILSSLRRLVQQNWRRLRTELQTYVALRGRNKVRLATFLREQAIELEDLYRCNGRSGWTNLKRDAGVLIAAAGPEDDYFGRRFGDLLHLDDSERIDLLLKVGEPGAAYLPSNERECRLLQMLAYQVDGQHHQRGTGADFLQRLLAHPDHRTELAELGEVLQARNTLHYRLIPGLEDAPLCLHGAYGIREILTALGWLTAERRTPFQAGVLALHERKTELLFVTLDKREGFHERITYRDYAISAERFHWQSQNSASPNTAAGRRYLQSPGNGWSFQLFVRRSKGEAYRACGPVTLERSEGARPMTVYWTLVVPLPVRLFQEFSILRGE